MEKVSYETKQLNVNSFMESSNDDPCSGNDFMDPIENTDTNNSVLATVSTEINKQEPVHQGHAPIRYTSNQLIDIGNSIKGDARYKIIRGSMCNRICKLRLNKRRERGWKVHSRDESRGVNSKNLVDIHSVVRNDINHPISLSS